MISKERNKILKIIHEVYKYFLENTNTHSVVSKVDFNNNETVIQFDVKLNENDEIENTLKKLNKMFSVQRYREVEELYWNLTGDSYTSDETNLVGMMVDEFKIERLKDGIKLCLIRRG